MKKNIIVTDYARYIEDFFMNYLPNECGYTHNTITSYAYTFSQLTTYMRDIEGVTAEVLSLKDFTKDKVIHFLLWLEQQRKCSVSSRNAKLAAIHSFAKYLQYRNIVQIKQWQEILSIKSKKHPRPHIEHLSVEAVKLILEQPNKNIAKGFRDYVFIALLYDSGARIQEIINLTPENIRFDNKVTIKVIGKGNKARTIPISQNVSKYLYSYIIRFDLLQPENICKPLFPNPQGNQLSRMAALNIVKKYADKAYKINPQIIPKCIGCHTFRHSRAMHMIEANVGIVDIRDFLGHSSIVTTEIYARISDQKKMEALAKVTNISCDTKTTTWHKNRGLLQFLKRLSAKNGNIM